LGGGAFSPKPNYSSLSRLDPQYAHPWLDPRRFDVLIDRIGPAVFAVGDDKK